MNVKFDSGELRALSARLSRAVEARDSILREIAVAEGVYAGGCARRIAKNERGLVNTGLYRRSFHTGGIPGGGQNASDAAFDGTEPEISDGSVRIQVYNPLEYASYLEYGFRRHFVPGRWEGHTFRYIPGFRPKKGESGGMMVGPKPAHNTLSRALAETERTQRTRVQKKLSEKLNSLLER